MTEYERIEKLNSLIEHYVEYQDSESARCLETFVYENYDDKAEVITRLPSCPLKEKLFNENPNIKLPEGYRLIESEDSRTGEVVYGTLYNSGMGKESP